MTSTLEMASWLFYFGTLITSAARVKTGCYYEPEHCSYCGKDGLHGVRAVCTDNAKLKMIPNNLPPNLTVLNADRNAIEQLTVNSLKKFPMLKDLELGYNDMIKIENFTFVKQGVLAKLSLKVNEIAVINDNTFVGLRSLIVLDLSKNKIETLGPGIFKALVSLNTLKLGQNHVKTIPTGTFDRLDNLETLELNDNKIKVLEKESLGNLMSLRKLFLNHNELEDVDFEVFSCAPIIRLLKLNNNKLRSVPKAIRSLEFLRNLSLNVNPISLIGSDAFLGLKRLQLLDLSNCHISVIERGSLQHIAQARNFTLSLNGNLLHCDCKLSWLREWSSSFHRLSINGTVCNSPSPLHRKVFSLVDPSEFVCTCDACAKDFNCAGANCSCDKNWAGDSCDVVCKSRQLSSETCVYSNGSCFCVNATSPPQRSRFSGCSFNVTTKVCGDDADFKKIRSSLDCACNDGFAGDGVQCHDIDECIARPPICFGKLVTCINTVGSYRCECSHGYKDNIPSSSQAVLCKDKNECTEMEDACHVNAKCYNTEGSYKCKCLEDFEGDGKTCLPKPAKPVNLSITVLSSTRALVTWSMANFSHVAWYRAEYKDVKVIEEWGQEGEMVRAPNITSSLLKGLKQGVTYKVRVGAFSNQNVSSYSERAIFSLPTDASSETYIVTAIAVMGAIILLVLVVSFVLHRRSKKMQGCQGRPNTLNTMEDFIELNRMHPRVTRGEVELGSVASPATKAPTLSCGDTVDTHDGDKWEVSRDRLRIGRQIGEGQFGMVFEGMLVSDKGTTKVAIKTLKYDADRFDYKDLVQEMEMMKEIGQHPNVVTFIGACTSTGPLYIITEYISGGNLLDFLRSSRRSNDSYVNVTSMLTSRDLLKVALDVACGMSHVAKKKFVHRDLAARNVLLTESHVAKVADFGLARDVYTEGKYVKTGGGRVPVKWMAPESIEYQLYTTKSDVWSFGVLLWEVITIGNMPYRYVPVNLLLRKLLNGHRMEKPPTCSDEMYEVMKACWQLEPEKRPTFDELCDILIDMLSASARAYVNVVENAEELRMSQLETVQHAV